LCVVAPSRFRLWNDAPVALGGVLGEGEEFEIRSFDPDDPASASPLALARSAAESDAVVTANLGRADLPPVVTSEIPVITWVTMPRIPAYESTASRDALILADPRWAERARVAGWPEERVFVGTWPVFRTISGNDSGRPALIADTLPLVPTKSVNEFSSHLLLWDLIVSELRHDPSLLQDDIDAYLTPRLKRLQIDEGAFNKALFIERLILPAYQQSIARALLGKNIPLRLFGKCWEEIEEFAPYAAGPVNSRQHFHEILGGSGALVHVWPTSHVHPVEFTTLPVIRPRHLAVHPDLPEIPAISGEIVRAALQ